MIVSGPDHGFISFNFRFSITLDPIYGPRYYGLKLKV